MTFKKMRRVVLLRTPMATSITHTHTHSMHTIRTREERPSDIPMRCIDMVVVICLCAMDGVYRAYWEITCEKKKKTASREKENFHRLPASTQSDTLARAHTYTANEQNEKILLQLCCIINSLTRTLSTTVVAEAEKEKKKMEKKNHVRKIAEERKRWNFQLRNFSNLQ